MSVFLSLAPAWLDTVFYIYWFVLIIMLIMDDREPSITLAWLFILLFLPFIGVFFYIFFGRDWKVVAQRHGWVQRLRETEVTEMAPIYERNVQAVARFYEEWGDSIAEPISRAISKENVARVLPASSLELYNDGAHKYRRLKEDLAGAQRFIHLQYFIWEQDRLTAELVPILLDRLEAGVEVRIMYDWMGCISFRKAELRQLKRAGALVEADVTDLLRINYRNHRKIVVIDGEIGYTGGMNVGQEYIDGGDRFATWRDTHMRLTGQAVAALEKLFAARWFEHKKKEGGADLFRADYMPAPDPDAVANGTLVEVAAQERGPPHAHGRHRPGRGVRVDPVAVLHPRLQHLRRHDQRRPERCRRALHDDRHPGQAHRPLGRPDLLPQAHRSRGARVPLQGGVPAREDDRRRPHRERRGHHEHGPAQPQAAQRDDGVGVRQGLRHAGRRPVRHRRDELPRGDPRGRALGRPPEEVPQPGGPSLLERALTRLSRRHRRLIATQTRKTPA
jgi:hypothetical protein